LNESTEAPIGRTKKCDRLVGSMFFNDPGFYKQLNANQATPSIGIVVVGSYEQVLDERDVIT